MTGCDVRIRRPDGSDCAAGERGEIVIKSEGLMRGYWQNDAATRETLRGGFLHTGDMGEVDDARLRLRRRSAQGDDRLGRGEHLFPRSRECAGEPSGRAGSGGGRGAGRALGREGRRVRRAAAGRRRSAPRISPRIASRRSPPTSAHARSGSSRACRSCRTARSRNTNCANRYGRARRARYERVRYEYASARTNVMERTWPMRRCRSRRPDGVALVTFNRPDKKNAMNPQLHEDMTNALEELRYDDAARACW